MESKILASLGIILNMVGLILIFIYGISPFLKAEADGTHYFYLNEQEMLSDKLQIKRKFWQFLATIGLIISLIGSVLQILSLFIS